MSSGSSHLSSSAARGLGCILHFVHKLSNVSFFTKFFLHQQLVAALEGPRPHIVCSHLRSCVQPPCAHPLRIGQLRHRVRQHQDPILDLTQILLTTIFQVLPWPPSTRGAPKFTLHIFRMPEQPKEGGIWAFITLYGQDNEPALARSHLQERRHSGNWTFINTKQILVTTGWFHLL